MWWLNAIDPVVGVVVAALAAPLIGYLLAVRRFSGRIESSEAKQLWEEARAMRSESQRRIEHLEDRVLTLERENQALHEANRELQNRIYDLLRKIADERPPAAQGPQL